MRLGQHYNQMDVQVSTQCQLPLSHVAGYRHTTRYMSTRAMDSSEYARVPKCQMLFSRLYFFNNNECLTSLLVIAPLGPPLPPPPPTCLPFVVATVKASPQDTLSTFSWMIAFTHWGPLASSTECPSCPKVFAPHVRHLPRAVSKQTDTHTHRQSRVMAPSSPRMWQQSWSVQKMM